jgi:hypothetical protein
MRAVLMEELELERSIGESVKIVPKVVDSEKVEYMREISVFYVYPLVTAPCSPLQRAIARRLRHRT